MFKSKLTDQDLATIKTMALQGEKYRTIANKIGKVSHQRIKQICQIEGIDAFLIRQTNTQKEVTSKMESKWGKDWKDKEVRRSYVYQTMRAKFRQKKHNSKGRPWNIEFGDLVFPTHCPVLGIELDYFNEEHKPNSPSFDCLVPELGYVKGNVFVISMRANRIKNDGTAEEHLAIAKYIQQPPKT